jgi:hypothetical protein
MHLSASQLEGAVKANFPHLVLLRRRVMGQPGDSLGFGVRSLGFGGLGLGVSNTLTTLDTRACSTDSFPMSVLLGSTSEG